ncbi:MAG: hypothetical protein DMF24_07420, partial [Verrucomicrobia bacterium]
SQIQQILRFQGINIVRFQRILNAADPLFDPTSSEFIGQTIPFNPMVDSQNVTFPGNLPLIDFARLITKDIVTSKLATLDLNIYTTDLFDLPAGGVGLAFGGQFNRESYRIDPDDQNRLGENADTSSFPPVKAGRKSWGIYAETLIPIFSPKWHIPGFYALEFSAGIRFDEWLNNDTNAAVPKVGSRPWSCYMVLEGASLHPRTLLAVRLWRCLVLAGATRIPSRRRRIQKHSSSSCQTKPLSRNMTGLGLVESFTRPSGSRRSTDN